MFWDAFAVTYLVIGSYLERNLEIRITHEFIFFCDTISIPSSQGNIVLSTFCKIFAICMHFFSRVLSLRVLWWEYTRTLGVVYNDVVYDPLVHKGSLTRNLEGTRVQSSTSFIQRLWFENLYNLILANMEFLRFRAFN